MPKDIRVKICGVTTVADALACVDLGADALGVNFWSKSKRRCELDEARRIAAAVGARARVVAVFVDAERDEIERVLSETGIGWAQLHGSEPHELVAALAPRVIKAVHVNDEASAALALEWPAGELLVDASLPDLPGGTGTTCDWTLAARVARERPVWLAGGLDPENVARAIEVVRPFGVDVASGVERSPGVKDLARVRAFIEAVRRA